jgi:hypothetical protein
MCKRWLALLLCFVLSLTLLSCLRCRHWQHDSRKRRSLAAAVISHRCCALLRSGTIRGWSRSTRVLRCPTCPLLFSAALTALAQRSSSLARCPSMVCASFSAAAHSPHAMSVDAKFAAMIGPSAVPHWPAHVKVVPSPNLNLTALARTPNSIGFQWCALRLHALSCQCAVFPRCCCAGWTSLPTKATASAG